MLKVLVELAPLIQIGILVFALGVFVNQSRSTKALADGHDSRLKELEGSWAKMSVVVESAARTIEKVEGRLQDHIDTSPCDAHTVTLAFIKDELAHLRGRVEDGSA